MKKNLQNRLLHLGCLLAVCMGSHAQNQVANSSFSFLNANDQLTPFTVQVKSSLGTVCDNGQPQILNYNNTYHPGQALPPGGVHWNDSTNITNGSKSITVGNRFKAIAGRPINITLDLYVAYGNNAGSNAGFYINTIENNVEGRIGTLGRHTENGSNPVFDDEVNFVKTGDAVFDGYGFHFNYTGTFVFKRGSEAGYVFLDIPIKNYDGNTRYEEYIIPYLVAGPLDEQVKRLGFTTDPQVPYMVLHDPPGDGSIATISKTTQSCRSMEETYSTDESNSVNASVKLGLKGSIGFVATIDYEIFAEFSAQATIGNLKMGNTSTQSCIAATSDINTSSLDPEANTGDLFIGYGQDMWYAVTDNLEFDACSYKITRSLIYEPKGNLRHFVYTRQDVLDQISAQTDSLTAITQRDATDSLRRRDSARIIYQVNVWKQILQMNDSNKVHPDESAASEEGFGSASSLTYSTTTDVTETNSLTLEHYIDAEVGLQGVVNIGGSGFSAGYKYTTSKHYGNTSTSQGSTSQTVSYTLADNDPGDYFNLRIVKDPMFGTPIFQLQEGTKSSCPYEGGIQRDQPKIEIAGTTDSLITFPNVPVGQYQSFDLHICNDAAEPRAYRLRLKNNNNNLVATAGGNPGPNFTSEAGIQLGAKGSPTQCVTYQVDVHQLNPTSLSFPNLQFELFNLCDDGIAQSVFATINYGSLVKSVTSGSWDSVTTWEAKRVPQPTDSVLINSNHTVTLPVNSDLQCKGVQVNTKGILVIPPTARLTVKGSN